MQPSRSRPIPFLIAAALISVCVAAPSAFAQTPPVGTQTPPATAPMPSAGTPEQSLSGAQLQKINRWITENGRDIAVTPIITEILGLTKGDQAISCRAFAAEGDGNEIHQIYVLPEGKGYLDAHFYQDKLDVYWADKNFALIAALKGVRGEKPAPTTFTDAQYGFRDEVAWWAKFTDTH